MRKLFLIALAGIAITTTQYGALAQGNGVTGPNGTDSNADMGHQKKHKPFKLFSVFRKNRAISSQPLSERTRVEGDRVTGTSSQTPHNPTNVQLSPVSGQTGTSSTTTHNPGQ